MLHESRQVAFPARRFPLRLAAFLLLAFLPGAAPALAQAAAQPTSLNQQIGNAVVRITASSDDGADGGTGFVWKNSTWVVTALHVVAGKNVIQVYSQEEGNVSRAHIRNVLLEADLALLQLDQDIGLKPLPVASTPPDITQPHTIWGYPEDVAKLQGDPVRFSLSLDAKTTFDSIFRSQASFLSAIGGGPFPQFSAEILRVSSILVHGHSGAPILNQSGQVVGIGDGGLHDGIARKNWAIPASTYLNRLPTSRDPIPGAFKPAGNLFSSQTDESTATTVAAPQSDDPDEAPQVLRLVGTTSIGAVVDSWPDEDEKYDDLRTYFDFLAERYKSRQSGPNIKDFYDVLIDIYEQTATGATIAIPHNLQLRYTATGRSVVAYSPDHQIEMVVQMADAGTPRNAVAWYNNFNDYMNSRAKWVKYGNADSDTHDNHYRYTWLNRAAYDPENPQVLRSVMFARLITRDSNFIGTMVVGWNQSAESKEDLDLYTAMCASVQLANFAN